LKFEKIQRNAFKIYPAIQVCRLAYEIMQSINADASSRFVSLDNGYFCHGYTSLGYQVAQVPHEAINSDEINIEVGDVIELTQFFQGHSMSTGRNLRTSQTGQYPSYKSTPQVRTTEYPMYPEVLIVKTG